jgi:hypothetical protein
MKIRIKGNSIRFRLTKSEVDTFARTGYIEDRTEFGNHLFMYALRRNPDVHELQAGFVGIKITMHVPAWMAEEWTTTDEVGYNNVYTYDNGKQLSLLLEKDFVCIDTAVKEDQSDNFVNPLHSCGPAGQAVQVEAYVAEQAAPVEENATEQMEEPAAEQQPIVHYTLEEESEPSNIDEPVVNALEEIATISAPVWPRPDTVEEPVFEAVQNEPIAEAFVQQPEPVAEEVMHEPTPAIAPQPVFEAVQDESIAEVFVQQPEPIAEEANVEPEPITYYTLPDVAEEVHHAQEEVIFYTAPEAVAAEIPVAEVANVVEAEQIADHMAQETPLAELVNEVLEHHPWLQSELEEAAPSVDAPQPSTQRGPVRPPNWR